MNNYTDLILRNQSGEMTIVEREEFNRYLSKNIELRKEFIFQEKLDNIMKKSLLLEAIESDPDLIKAEILARRDIDSYLNKRGVTINKGVISHFNIETEFELRKKIAKAEVEMVLSGIDEISDVWVRSFEELKPALLHDFVALRIMEFIKESKPFTETVIKAPSVNFKVNRKVFVQLAAAVLVLSMLLFKSLTPSYSGDFVFERYYEPLEANSFSLRGHSQDANGKLQEGVDYYLSKNYKKAETAFNELQKMNTNLPEMLLFSGLNQMGLGNIPAAITLFSDLLSSKDQFVPEAQWYLGLCYLKTGDNLKARSLMETMSETEGIYKKKAQLILKNLNQ